MRDSEVRNHEAVHLAAAEGLSVGGTSYRYQRGPDDVQYAVRGKVNIDTSAVMGKPSATLDKAQRIRAAALAPAQPFLTRLTYCSPSSPISRTSSS
jgi:hypothetical protein